jgi:hypothetical protein
MGLKDWAKKTTGNAVSKKYAATVAKDGTVKYWDVMRQQWREDDAPSLMANAEVLSTLSDGDRAKIKAAAAKYHRE